MYWLIPGFNSILDNFKQSSDLNIGTIPTGEYCEKELTFEFTSLSRDCHIYMDEACLSRGLGQAIIGK